MARLAGERGSAMAKGKATQGALTGPQLAPLFNGYIGRASAGAVREEPEIVGSASPFADEPESPDE